MINIARFKIVIVGDGDVGKTTFCQHYGLGELLFQPTLGVNVFPVLFKDNDSQVVFDVWDCAGQKKYGAQNETYWNAIKAAIIMIDGSNKSSCNCVSIYTEKLRNINSSVQIILCVNKVDCLTLSDVDIYNLAHEVGINDIVYISAKTGNNIDEPFTCLSNKLLGGS